MAAARRGGGGFLEIDREGGNRGEDEDGRGRPEVRRRWGLRG